MPDDAERLREIQDTLAKWDATGTFQVHAADLRFLLAQLAASEKERAGWKMGYTAAHNVLETYFPGKKPTAAHDLAFMLGHRCEKAEKALAARKAEGLALPPVGEVRKCLLCAYEKPWGIFSSRTGETVCVECRDAKATCDTLRAALRTLAGVLEETPCQCGIRLQCARCAALALDAVQEMREAP